MNLFSKWNLDALGIGASLACAVHCVLLPLVVTALPLLGFELFENENLEYGLLAFSFVVGYTALFRGYRKHHRHLKPLLLFSAGFAGLLAGHFLAPESLEPFVIIAGAGLIVWAHLRNIKECKNCKVCRHEDEVCENNA
ncbi:MerC domain-containing protein [Chitinophaga lutea]|uniref:MerC domain-containing protein n=1 Tax=Chitinophaga lutea TaxID=2488634 RepID=A0A3N4QNX0_9BACT|nr:MerC domain-containing protein [Chitinophaga lutea]RPE13374.1 MerC domain-containing protein [Chitinophaga lutea]